MHRLIGKSESIIFNESAYSTIDCVMDIQSKFAWGAYEHHSNIPNKWEDNPNIL